MTPTEHQPVQRVVDEAAMKELAQGLAGAIQPPVTLFLEGALGAGKTTFARALIQALGHEGRVKSPTYGILEHYTLGACEVLHLDLYRVGDPGELEFLGLADLLGPGTVLLVEWAERGRGMLPPPDLVLSLQSPPDHSDNKRRLSAYAHSRSGNELCSLIDSSL